MASRKDSAALRSRGHRRLARIGCGLAWRRLVFARYPTVAACSILRSDDRRDPLGLGQGTTRRRGTFLNAGPGERSPASQPESAPSAYDHRLASLHTTRERDRSRAPQRGVPSPSDRSKRATWERDHVCHCSAPRNKPRWRAVRSVHQLTLDGPSNRPALALKTLRRSSSLRCGAG